MKILLAVSKRYARLLIDAIVDARPKPKVTILSPDEEVAILAKTLGMEYRSDLTIERLYASEELEEYDLALIAMDDDQDNIALARAAKSMNIPVVVSILNDSGNRDLLIREGVNYIVDINEFAANIVKTVVLLDTWVTIRLSTIANIAVAFHRIVKRGVLGVTLMELEEAVGKEDAKFMLLERGNKVIMDSSKMIETGDVIVVTGTEEGVRKVIDKIERIFRKHEEIYARRYAETLRTTTRGYG
ncbi:MAG: NAD-binding protein [Ignisphaera sp.]